MSGIDIIDSVGMMLEYMRMVREMLEMMEDHAGDSKKRLHFWAAATLGVDKVESIALEIQDKIRSEL